MSVITEGALEYLRAHGIALEVAEAVGVRVEDDTLVFPCAMPDGMPFERRRRLNGAAKTLQPSGIPLCAWWPAGRPDRSPDALVLEGESDALAALTALKTAPRGLHRPPVVAVPGTGYPAHRLAGDLAVVGVREAWLCFDGDDAGRAYLEKATAVLREADIRVIPVPLPDGSDLADNVALESNPGDWLANLLVDCESAEYEAREAELEVPMSIVRFIRRFVVLGDHELDAIALWVVHTHAFEAADATPYLSITSAEKESGKTRLLEVLELLVARPWHTGRVTAAVLARKVDRLTPTLLLDESDAAFQSDREYAEALRGMLNTGYRRGGKASVCVGQGANIDFKDLSTFCPKGIAGIGKLPDTVASRSIPIRLARKRRDEPLERFRRRRVEGEAEALRDRIAQFVERHPEALRLEPDVPTELGDRAADCWEPLFAISDVVGHYWPIRARQAAVALSGAGDLEEESVGIQLLADIRAVYEEGESDRIATAELLQELKAREESPWGAWGSKRREPGLTDRDLAKLLRPYGIRSRSIRLADGRTPKGFLFRQFEDPWTRYLLPAPAARAATTPHPASYARSGVDEPRHSESGVAVPDPPTSAAQADCGGVAADPQLDLEAGAHSDLPAWQCDDGPAGHGGQDTETP